MATPLGSPNVTPWDRQQAMALLTAAQAGDDSAIYALTGEIVRRGRTSVVLFTMTSLAVSGLHELAQIRGTTPEALIQSMALGLRRLDL